MRKDIYGGLKNALERGESLEQAVRSFINAGYPESEVRQTAQTMSSGMSTLQQPQVNNQQNELPPLPKRQISQLQTPQISKVSQVQALQGKQMVKNKIDWKLIILGISLLFLVLILVVSFFLRESIIKFFGG